MSVFKLYGLPRCVVMKGEIIEAYTEINGECIELCRILGIVRCTTLNGATLVNVYLSIIIL